MLRRQGKSNVPQADVMSRQETAVWLGRALSTNEITLRVVLELLDVVAFQQAAIKRFYEQDQVGTVNPDGEDPGPEVSEVSQKIVEKLTQLREELDPVLKTVEDACQQFEKMIQPPNKQARHS